MNHKEYNRPLEFDIEQVKKRNKMKDREEMEKYKQLYTDIVADLNDYKNLYIRQRSEMENYSKYKEREITNIRKNASSDLIKELLPVLYRILGAYYILCGSSHSLQGDPMQKRGEELYSNHQSLTVFYQFDLLTTCIHILFSPLYSY